MRRKLVVSLILIVVCLLVGAGVASLLITNAPQPAQVDVSRPPLLVRTVRIEPVTVVEPIEGFGTARAHQAVRLSAQAADEIIEMADGLKVGAHVTAGQVLVRINDAEYRQILARTESLLAAAEAELRQLDVEVTNLDQLLGPAQRELASAQWEYDKVRELREQGAAPQREYEKAVLTFEQTRRMVQNLENQKALIPAQRARLEAARADHQAAVAIAKLDVDRCTVRAPFDGRVAERMVEVGERVQRGTHLLTLLDPRLIEVPVQLPVSVLSRVAVGAPCSLTTPAVADVTWQGHVKRIAPAADELTRTFELFVEVDNAGQPRELVPGFFVHASIQGPTLHDVLVIPRGSIQQGHVFICRDGQAQRRQVQVSRFLSDQAVVTGLTPGDRVITSNLDALYEGLKVRIDLTQVSE